METLKRAPTDLSGRHARCSAHGCYFARLLYFYYNCCSLYLIKRIKLGGRDVCCGRYLVDDKCTRPSDLNNHNANHECCRDLEEGDLRNRFCSRRRRRAGQCCPINSLMCQPLFLLRRISVCLSCVCGSFQSSSRACSNGMAGMTMAIPEFGGRKNDVA